jgi:site-specific DNA-methyltransferase (adenine-specific)
MCVELLHQDCMDYMKGCSDNAFDLAICDPPYGRGEHGGVKRSSMAKQKNGSSMMVKDGDYLKKGWDTAPPPPEYFSEVVRVSKNQIIWGVNYHPQVLQGGRIIWDKINDGSSQSGAEIAYCSLNQRVDIVRYLWRGMMQGLEVNNPKQQGNKKLNERRIHPTQKPVKLYRWILDNYAKPTDNILDTHLGSGSSAIAADDFGCNFVGLEKDEEYYKAACDRFDAAPYP